MTTKEEVLDALGLAIHFGANLPRGILYDEAMEPIVAFYWKTKAELQEEKEKAQDALLTASS